MSITHNRQFNGVWIPAEIWLENGLNALEKILLVEINSLDNENGCTAGNDYLSGFLGVTTIRVSQMIKKLKDDGYIYEESFDGRVRTLKSNIKTIVKQSKDDYKSGLKEIIKQNKGNYKADLKEIINNNNTLNNQSNNSFNKKESSLQKIEEISEAIPTCIDSDTWEEWKHYRHKEKKQKLTPSTTQKQLQQLQKWHSEGHDPNEIINCSIMNGWSGLFPPKDKQIKKNNSTVKDSNQDHLDKKVEKLITEIKSELLEYPDDFYNRSEQLKRTAEDWKIIENNSKIHEKYNIKDYRFVLDYILEIKQPCGKKGVPRAEFISSYKNEFINMYGESSVLALYNYFIATKDEKFFPSVEDYGK